MCPRDEPTRVRDLYTRPTGSSLWFSGPAQTLPRWGCIHGGRAGLNKALSREKTHQILSLCFNLTPTLGPPQDHYMALGGTLQGLLEIKDTHRPRALQWGYA